MRTAFMLLVVAAGLARPLAAGSFDFARFDELLARYAKDGRLRYGRLVGERQGIDELVQALSLIDARQVPAGSERKAFWINTYNALAIRALVQAQPVSRVTEVTGFFSDPRHDLGGDRYSLDRILAEELRRPFHDPRIHFAVVPGSLSGPALPARAYRTEDLDEALDASARAFLLRPDTVQVDENAHIVHVSPIFEWYAADFAAEKPGSDPEEAWRAFLQRFAPAVVKEVLGGTAPFHVRADLPYDWTVNDVLLARKKRFEWPWTKSPPSPAP